MENNNEFDSKIRDIKEIVELSSDEIENNEEIATTLDLEDLKSLKFLYEESLKMRREIAVLKSCIKTIQANIWLTMSDADDVIMNNNYINDDDLRGTDENKYYYYKGVKNVSSIIQCQLNETYDKGIIDIND